MKRKLLLAVFAALVGLFAKAQTWTASEVGAGNFMLYNVGTGQYLTKGNGWGTQASITTATTVGNGFAVKLESVGDNFKIRTNINGDGKGLEHLSGGTIYTDQSNEKNSTWTFTQVGTDNGPIYTICSADNHGGGSGVYLTAGADGTIVTPGADGTIDGAKWKLMALPAQPIGMNDASEDNPVDATSLIVNQNFSFPAILKSGDGSWTVNASNNNLCGGDATNPCAESWRSSFTISQTLTVPNGVYELTAQAALTDYANKYDGANYPVVYANNETAVFNEMSETDRGSSMTQLSGSFTRGDYGVGPIRVVVTNGSLTVGVRGTRTDTWCIWDNFRLTYKGVDLSELRAALQTQIDAVPALEGTTTAAAYTAAKNYADGIDVNSLATEEAISTASSELSALVNSATSLQDVYASYVAYKVVVGALDDDATLYTGDATIDVASVEEAVEAATTVEVINNAIDQLYAAAATFLSSVSVNDGKQFDVTNVFLTNAGFETGNLNAWTNTGMQTQGNTSFEKTGTFYAEAWEPNGTKSITQVMKSLPAGYYTLSANVKARGLSSARIYAGDVETNVTIADVTNVYSIIFNCAANANVTVGFEGVGTGAGTSWFALDGITVTYLGTAPLVLFQNELADAVSAARSHASGLVVPAAALTAYNNAIDAAAADNTSIAACQAGVAAIETATATADALVDNYAAYLKAVDDATFAGVVSGTISQQNDIVATATSEGEIDACTKVLQAAIDALAIDITSFTITNPTAQNKDGWEGTDFGTASDGVCEYWNKSGADFHQTVSLPAGNYRLTVVALQRTGRVGYVYAGENKTTIAQVSNSIVNNRAQAATWFNNGNGVNYVYFTLAEAGDVTIGLTADATTADYWTVWKSFALETFTEAAAASYMKPGYDEAMAAAVAYQDDDMFDEDKTALNTAITENTVEEASATIAAYETAIANLNAAAAAAATAVANYTQYNAVVTAIGEKTNVDLTEYVTNAGFEEGTLTGWTSVDGGNVANNGNFGRHQGTWFAERWKNGVALGNGSLTHDAIVLPAGVYRVTADAQNIEQYNGGAAGTGLFLYANEERTEIGASANYAVYVKLADKTPLTIKFVQDNCTGNWISYDNVTLTYVDEDYVYALVDGKMNATVSAAQTAAETVFIADKNDANYTALVSAITAAQASKDAYAAAGAAIADANALKEAHNFATDEAITTFANAIAAIETPYNENTLSDADAANAGKTLGTVVTGGRTGADGAAVNYMENAFGLNDFDAALYVNTWSIEGESDGSNFKVPFYEYFAGEGNSLGANTWTATLNKVPNGLYNVSVWVRVRTKNDETAATDATGISMNVNGGTAVDVTEGDQVGESRFQLKEYTAEGLVKDSVLKLNIDIDAENNIHWLSFKNIKYIKVRDLTPEEEAVAPTAIALYVGEEEVSEAIILNGSETTVTLTTSLSPAEATPGFIEWESADENIATVTNGVIKANGAGTTTITAKSTIDPTITATATVVAYAFKNQSFEADGNLAASNSTNPNMIAITGWSQEQNTAGSYQDNQVRDASTDNNSNYGKRVTPSNGSYYLFYRHGWNGSNYAKFTSDAQNLPIGKYTLSVDYKMVSGSDNTSNNNNTSITLSAINGETTLATATKKDAIQANNNSSTAYLTNNEWLTLTTEFVLTEATEVQAVINLLACGPKRSDFVVDNVTLTWESMKVVLNGVLAEANGIDVITNVGDAVFQIPQSAADELTNAISTAQGVYDDSEATEDEVIDQISALNAAIAAYADPILNAPAADQLYNIVVATSEHAKENNPVIIYLGTSGANNPTGYGLNANLAANRNLQQAFKFTKVEGNNYKISTQLAEGEVFLTNGSLNGSAADWKNSQIQATTDAEKAMAFKIEAADVEGTFVIYNTVTNSTIACQSGGNLYTEDGNAYFKVVETAKPSITINTTAAGWGTVMLPFAQALPEGMTAYSVNSINGEKLVLEEVYALEANKPYILEGAWEGELTGDAQGTALTYTDGLLTGVYSRIPAPDGSYILQNQVVEGVGFYQVNISEAQPNVPANRAYLTVPAEAAGVKAFILGGNDETAIKSVFDGVANGDIYDLGGRKVQRMQKGGVYVVNGKKVIVK